MTKFLNISTDTSLGGNSPSDDVVASQKAISTALSTKQDTLVSGTNIKTVNGTSLLGSGDITISSSVNWGFIGGTLADQTDLKTALDAKADDNGVVHLANAETITGDKTFTGQNIVSRASSIMWDYKNTAIDRTVTPSSNQHEYLDFLDKNGSRLGVMGARMRTDGKYGIYLQGGNEGYIGIFSNGSSVETYAPTPGTTDNSTKIATTAFVRNIVPAGLLAPFGGTVAPTGWLVCDGSAVSRTSYAELFAAIGTTYGTGDGSTTFNLPDLSGKQPIYDGTATIGDTTNGKAPNITGYFTPHAGSRGTSGVFGGAFYSTGVQEESGASTSGSAGRVGFNASRSSAVYDNNATGITPAGVYTLWCIKY